MAIDEIFADFSGKQAAEIIRWMEKECEVFQYYDALEMKEDKKQVLAEIEKLLNDKLSLMEIAEIHFLEVYADESQEYDKIAKLCLQLYFQSIVQKNRDKHRTMRKDSLFDDRFEFTKNEIIKYINGQIPEFPTEALKCLYLLTDGDLEPDRQGLTATQLVVKCMPYYKNDEQERRINAMILETMLE